MRELVVSTFLTLDGSHHHSSGALPPMKDIVVREVGGAAGASLESDRARGEER
jgi:hypothetical protein